MQSALSFDEMRMDDKIHGDGGDRKGRTENTLRCGFWDNGECSEYSTLGYERASACCSLLMSACLNLDSGSRAEACKSHIVAGCWFKWSG